MPTYESLLNTNTARDFVTTDLKQRERYKYNYDRKHSTHLKTYKGEKVRVTDLKILCIIHREATDPQAY